MQGRDELTAALRHARKVFACVKVFVTAVPTYVIGHFTHPMLSMQDFSKRITLGAVRRRFAQHPLNMKYYSPDVHAAAFALPEYVRRLCDRA